MSSISAGTTSTTGYVVTSDTTGALVLKTGASATTALTIDTSQNVSLAVGSANGVTYLNGSKVLTSGSALTFDGTNLGVGTTSPSNFAGYATVGINGSTGGILDLFVGGTRTVTLVGTTAEASLRTLTNTPLAFYINTSEQMRLTSTGLGIGTSSPQAKLVSAGSSSTNFKGLILRNGDGTIGSSVSIDFEASTGTQGDEAVLAGRISGVRVSGGTTGALDFFTNNAGTLGSAKMRLDSAGNLGVGTTSPSQRLDVTVSTGTEGSGLGITNSYSGGYGSGLTMYSVRSDTSAKVAAGRIGMEGSSSWNSNATTTSSMVFYTIVANTLAERVRIESSGNFLVGTTSGYSGERQTVAYNGSTQRGIVVRDTASQNSNPMAFVYGSTLVGYIGITSSSTSYNTSSDYRLKNTIAPMTGALAKVAQLKPCTYKWNADGSDGEGFIAHELAEVCPHAVTGEKDAVETYVDEDGNEQTRPVYQGIDTSFLVATLTAAIQEQQAMIQQLQADVATLKGVQ